MKKITMNNNAESITISELLERFLIKCKVKNLTEKSIDSYKVKCKWFIEYVGSDTEASSITQKSVDDYILYQMENGRASAISINSYLRSVRALLYYGMDLGYIDRFKVHMLKAEKKLKETYTDEELKILLKKPNVKKCSFAEFKVWALENYLLATGNRISTAVNVKIGDLHFEERIIVLRKTKNRQQQIIPMSEALERVLREYLAYRGGSPDDYLFCNYRGEQSCTGTYQKLVKVYNRSRGVMKTGCHLFRHTFAKKWILAGGDGFRLQRLLGHSDMTVTKEYLSLFGSDLQKDYDRMCPLDNLQGNIIRMR